VVSVFFRNDHYPNEEAYLYAIAEAMRHEYEAVAGAGFVLQIDCPDLAMGKHIKYYNVDLKNLPQAASSQHRGPEPCGSRIFRPINCACMCAGATMKAHTTMTSHSPM